jgi:hypothetical protein
MKDLYESIVVHCRQLLAILDVPPEVLHLYLPPPIDDLQQSINLSYELLIDNKRYGARIPISRHEAQNLTPAAIQRYSQSFVRTIATDIGLAYHPQSNEIYQTLQARKRFPRLPLWLALCLNSLRNLFRA